LRLPSFLFGMSKKSRSRRPRVVEEVLVRPALLKTCLLFALALSLALLALPGSLPYEVELGVGDVAPRDVRADRDLMILDQTATVSRRLEVRRGVLPVFDLDDQAADHSVHQIQELFARGRTLYSVAGQTASGGAEAAAASPQAKFREQFNQVLNFGPEDKTFETLVQSRFPLKMEKVATQLISDLLERGVAPDKDLQSFQGEKTVVRRLSSNSEETRSNMAGFLDQTDARQMVLARALLYRDDFTTSSFKTLIAVSRAMLRPNLRYNLEETERRRRQVASQSAPVYFQVKSGEMVIREGERVDAQARVTLEALARSDSGSTDLQRMAGLFLLAMVFVLVLYTAGVRSPAGLQLRSQDLVFLSILLVSGFLLAEIGSIVGQALVRAGTGLMESTLLYAMPLAACGMLAAIFLGPWPAFLFAVLLSFLTALLLDNLALGGYYFLGTVAGQAGVLSVRERGGIIKAGLAAGLVNMVVLLGVALYQETFFSTHTLLELGAGLLSGLAAGIIVTGLTPLFEMLFRYSTDIKLMELSNLDRPVLRELMIQAPGTYHHSVIVGALVEAAAKAIGANHLLAKVAAYYHDLGKLKKPLYFVENQGGGDNRHERLASSMSALILISHVKDGLELARQNKLGREIVDIIQQHHGTCLITYFYQKALDTHNGEQSQISEQDYRYPGPKPQTKEAGLVLLADAVEAASRTLVDPTPARIQGLVQKIINGSFSDGQLDECELTLKDLHLIARSFNTILHGIHHRRIAYPEPARKEPTGRAKAGHGHRPQQSANGSSDRAPAARGPGAEDLKRLGQA
jgi:hypothetical protein